MALMILWIKAQIRRDYDAVGQFSSVLSVRGQENRRDLGCHEFVTAVALSLL